MAANRITLQHHRFILLVLFIGVHIQQTLAASVHPPTKAAAVIGIVSNNTDTSMELTTTMQFSSNPSSSTETSTTDTQFGSDTSSSTQTSPTTDDESTAEMTTITAETTTSDGEEILGAILGPADSGCPPGHVCDYNGNCVQEFNTQG